MIEADDLLAAASDALTGSTAELTEAVLRRAVSTAYYGLFHLLTAAGAGLLVAGGRALPAQVARSYSHATMRKVCEAYRRLDMPSLPALLERVLSADPDPRLLRIAGTFVQLQAARHDADYNPTSTFKLDYASDLVDLAKTARQDFEAIRHLPETTTFLTALLLADRWTRRG